ncbi:hypothetical protein B6U55_02165 [Ligilactobacillus salivarius]|uniref:cyclic-di-AMP-binding protein CbpB n=1 Tax=Ligilactobacillus salivarius TaxID=1624 RepID=UPI0009DADB7D|nr:cyclic-di-AMP-binding protein CbpB [Ligilactobacillus salivarius]OQQ93559.1 hypothetical protein B6U55_02165 [Ligilactobacillus salivarius]
MMSQPIEQMLMRNSEDFLIPADIVANVQEENHLDHAFMVLTKVRYAKIPVLDHNQKFKGLLSLSMITEEMLGLKGIDARCLSKKQVKDVMQTEVETIKTTADCEEILHRLVNQPFLVVVDDDNRFLGIVTRRELLKSMNYLSHEFDNFYVTEPK